jgi:hypothetical protein
MKQYKILLFALVHFISHFILCEIHLICQLFHINHLIYHNKILLENTIN